MQYIQAHASYTEDQPPTIAWVLLLAAFFIAGWFTNDVIHRHSAPVLPQVGVGGGPTDDFSSQLKIYAPNAPENTQQPSHNFTPQGEVEQI